MSFYLLINEEWYDEGNTRIKIYFNNYMLMVSGRPYYFNNWTNLWLLLCKSNTHIHISHYYLINLNRPKKDICRCSRFQKNHNGAKSPCNFHLNRIIHQKTSFDMNTKYQYEYFSTHKEFPYCFYQLGSIESARFVHFIWKTCHYEILLAPSTPILVIFEVKIGRPDRGLGPILDSKKSFCGTNSSVY